MFYNIQRADNQTMLDDAWSMMESDAPKHAAYLSPVPTKNESRCMCADCVVIFISPNERTSPQLTNVPCVYHGCLYQSVDYQDVALTSLTANSNFQPQIALL